MNRSKVRLKYVTHFLLEMATARKGNMFAAFAEDDDEPTQPVQKKPAPKTQDKPKTAQEPRRQQFTKQEDNTGHDFETVAGSDKP